MVLTMIQCEVMELAVDAHIGAITAVADIGTTAVATAVAPTNHASMLVLYVLVPFTCSHMS